MEFVPESSLERGAGADRKAAGRAAARRRDAVVALRVAESVAGYGARRLADGLGPAQSRAAVLELAAELGEVAAMLRRLARVRAGERREEAAELAGLGLSNREIADRMGISPRTVGGYLQSADR